MTAHVTFLIPVVSCLSLRLPGMIFVQGFNGSEQGLAGWHCDYVQPIHP